MEYCQWEKKVFHFPQKRKKKTLYGGRGQRGRGISGVVYEISCGFYWCMKAGLGLPVSCKACFYQTAWTGLRSLAALRPPCCLIRTRTAGSWQKNKTSQEINHTISTPVVNLIIPPPHQHHQSDFNRLLLTGLTGSPRSESSSPSCLYMERISTRSTVLERFRKALYASRMRS